MSLTHVDIGNTARPLWLAKFPNSKKRPGLLHCPKRHRPLSAYKLPRGLLLSLSLFVRQATASSPLDVPGNATTSPSNTTTTVTANPTPIPLVVTNSCDETIWPGIATQNGIGPGIGGFELPPGATTELHVSPDWQGRVWGRTNCSFNADGSGPRKPKGVNGKGAACLTGDCTGKLNCEFGGEVPATLGEFNLMGGPNNKQSFYDISLVDGYNLPMALIYIPAPNTTYLSPDLTNPVCVASPGYYSLTDPAPSVPSPPLAKNLSTSLLPPFPNSTLTNSTTTNNTNASIPHYYSIPRLPAPPPSPLSASETASLLHSWCPWNLQLYPPRKPPSGIFPYPDSDTTIQRPAFDPCLSACSKTRSARDCCTGKFGSARICRPGVYSQMAKRVCPDAFSYAFDDRRSQFVVPAGGGWEVRFCPRGVESSRILERWGGELRRMAGVY